MHVYETLFSVQLQQSLQFYMLFIGALGNSPSCYCLNVIELFVLYVAGPLRRSHAELKPEAEPPMITIFLYLFQLILSRVCLNISLRIKLSLKMTLSFLSFIMGNHSLKNFGCRIYFPPFDIMIARDLKETY